jgi:hypothetical protein
MKTFFAFLIFVFVTTTTLFGQSIDNSSIRLFQYSESGLNDFVVTNIESKTKEEEYNKTLNWIKETYKNPDLVLKMKIENEKVRIEGSAIGLLKVRNQSSNLAYVLEISFKDNKYKFEIMSLLYDNNTDYKKIPNFKTDPKMIKNFGTTPTDIETYFNNLNESLRAYITGETKKNSDW